MPRFKFNSGDQWTVGTRITFFLWSLFISFPVSYIWNVSCKWAVTKMVWTLEVVFNRIHRIHACVITSSQKGNQQQ